MSMILTIKLQLWGDINQMTSVSSSGTCLTLKRRNEKCTEEGIS